MSQPAPLLPDPVAPGAPVPPQVVTRPPGARPGAPAPWAHLGAGERRGLSLARVVDALGSAGQHGEPVPGEEGPAARDALFGALDPDGATTAAVLAALFEEGGETRVLLTRRSARLRSHRGEVSFPGGRVEPGESLLEAALRESAEEVALEPSLVAPVGWLHPVVTFVTSSLIWPLVGTLAARPRLEANPAEVERVFDVALADLAAEGVFHEERWSVPGRPVEGSADGSFPVWFYEVDGELIWGATARMLTELVAHVLGVARERPTG